MSASRRLVWQGGLKGCNEAEKESKWLAEGEEMIRVCVSVTEW